MFNVFLKAFLTQVLNIQVFLNKDLQSNNIYEYSLPMRIFLIIILRIIGSGKENVKCYTSIFSTEKSLFIHCHKRLFKEIFKDFQSDLSTYLTHSFLPYSYLEMKPKKIVLLDDCIIVRLSRARKTSFLKIWNDS